MKARVCAADAAAARLDELVNGESWVRDATRSRAHARPYRTSARPLLGPLRRRGRRRDRAAVYRTTSKCAASFSTLSG